MGFRFPSTCSPTSRLDSPASFTIKIRPLGAEPNSCSNFASNVIAVPVVLVVVVTVKTGLFKKETFIE